MQRLKPVLVLFTAALATHCPLLAADKPDIDKEAIAVVDSIAAMPDDSPSLMPQLQPMMEKIAAMLEKDPANFRLHFFLARCYDKMGMEDLAASEDRAAEAGGDAYKNFVLSALKKKILANDFDAAMAYSSFAEKYFPNDSSVLIAKSIELHKAGKYEEEEGLLESVAHKNKPDLGVLTALGSIKARKGNYHEAIKLFDEDLKLNPEYKPALLGKAKTLEQMRCYKESLLLAVPLYREDPLNYELASLVTNGFLHMLGKVSESSSEPLYNEAFQPALVSLAVARSDAQMSVAKQRVIMIWRKIGVSQRQHGLTEVSTTLDKLTFGPRMHFALAAALQQAGLVQDAEFQYRAGLRIEPGHGRAYLHLGEIYQYNYHNYPAAILNYIKYLRFEGQDPLIQKRLARLAILQARTVDDPALRIKKRLRVWSDEIRSYLPWWWFNTK